jgi:hypothetical protein
MLLTYKYRIYPSEQQKLYNIHCQVVVLTLFHILLITILSLNDYLEKHVDNIFFQYKLMISLYLLSFFTS